MVLPDDEDEQQSKEEETGALTIQLQKKERTLELKEKELQESDILYQQKVKELIKTQVQEGIINELVSILCINLL